MWSISQVPTQPSQTQCRGQVLMGCIPKSISWSAVQMCLADAGANPAFQGCQSPSFALFLFFPSPFPYSFCCHQQQPNSAWWVIRTLLPKYYCIVFVQCTHLRVLVKKHQPLASFFPSFRPGFVSPSFAVLQLQQLRSRHPSPVCVCVCLYVACC